MPTLDRRTRRRADVQRATVGDLLAHRTGVDLAARAQERLGLPPLTLVVDGEPLTIDAGRIRSGRAEGAVAAVVDAEVLTSMVAGTRSTTGLLFQGGADLVDDSAAFVAWEHVLRALFDGVPLHEPGDVEFVDRHGGPLDLRRAFTPADDDADIAHFLAEAGFLHLCGWIAPRVVATIGEEVVAAADATEPGEPHRWWARLEDGSERCVRVMYLLEVSPTMAALVESAPYVRLGALFDDGHRRFPERAQSSEALLKPVGVVSGVSEFPWHRDCSFGGHAFQCAGYAVGLPLTPTGDDEGHLRVVAGSHRVSVPAPGTVPGYDVDLPVVSLHTVPGDVTVHLGCTLQMTVPPRRSDRAVAYTTFSLPPPEGDAVPDPDGAHFDPTRLADDG